MRRQRRYQIIAGAVAATLLVAGAVSHAPAARQLLRPAGASVRVVVPPEVKPTDEVYALVDNLLVRTGATPRPVGVIDMKGTAAAVDARGVGDFDGDDRDVPWRRLPAVGGRARVVVMMPLAPLRAEPVRFVHTRPAPVARELPPLKASPSVIVVGLATPTRASSPRSSPRTPAPEVGTVPDAPADEVLPPATLPPEVLPPELLPPELLPPSLGALPEGEPVPVPEPVGVSFAVALSAMTLVRRRR